MEVVKSPLPTDWSKQITCPCKAELKIGASDVRFGRQRQTSIWGSHEDWFTDLYYVICAVCKCKLDIGDILMKTEEGQVVMTRAKNG